MHNSDPTRLHAALRELETWQNSPSSGQRRFRRFAARGEARLTPGRESSCATEAISAHVRDISRGGIGMLTTDPLESGQYWQVQLLERGVTLATLAAFSRYCIRVVDGAYLVGAEFGVDASVILSLGVSLTDLAAGDDAEHRNALQGECVDPQSLSMGASDMT